MTSCWIDLLRTLMAVLVKDGGVEDIRCRVMIYSITCFSNSAESALQLVCFFRIRSVSVTNITSSVFQTTVLKLNSHGSNHHEKLSSVSSHRSHGVVADFGFEAA